MLKKIIILLFTSLLFMFISCPHDCTPEELKVLGKTIDNFPEWTKDVLVSDWKNWNTEETAEFKKLFKQKESLNSGDVNYRIFIDGQNIVLFFDDEERTWCNPLRVWVSEYEAGSNLISISQEKDDEFIFTGHAKSNPFDGNTEENKAYVKISLLDSETNECSYLLKVNDVEILNEEVTACNDSLIEIPYSYFMKVFEYSDEEKENRTTYIFDTEARLTVLGDWDYRFIKNEFLYFEGLSETPTYDKETKTLTYELLGGTDNMCHYLDIQYFDKDNIVCSYYNIVNEEKNIKYTEPLTEYRETVWEKESE